MDGEWEQGDEEDELVTEDHLLYEQMENRRNNIDNLDIPSDFDQRCLLLCCCVTIIATSL